MHRVAAVMLALAWTLTATAGEPDVAVRSAVQKGLRRIETGAANYLKNRQCFSCHHQHTSVVVLTAARQRGFTVEADAVRQQIDFTLEYWKPRLEQLKKGQGSGGGNTMVAHSLWTFQAASHPADETTAALVEYLLVKQHADGSWPALTKVRPPTEGSTLLNNSLALKVLKTYASSGEGKRVDAALAKGKQWLRKATPADTEDAAARLAGLAYAGAEKDEVAAARKALLEAQGEDGSWSQAKEMKGDAYATGTVMAALRASGLASDDAAYQKGVKYLLATQKDDGSWLVQTRAKPVQTFFDNGDPGGKSQFISFVATGRATLALLETLPVR